MNCFVSIVLSVLGILSSSSAVTITKCKAADSACMKLSAQAFVPILAVGIPEFGIKSLDPLHIPFINASSSYLKLNAKGVVVTGMKDCTIPDISRDKSKHTIDVDVLCTVDVQAEYDVNGKILLLPIDGSGHLSVQLYKILISVKSNLKDVVKDGKKYWHIDSWNFTWDLKDRATMELKDLFGGNQELTNAMRKMMGESATEVVRETGAPIVKAIVLEVVEAIRHLYSHVPADELALD